MKNVSTLIALILLAIFVWVSCEQQDVPAYLDAPVTDTSLWKVNANDYSNFMTMICNVQVSGNLASDVVKIAAFNGNAIRGASNAIDFDGIKIFNLLIFSNQENEDIEFAVYLTGINKAVQCKEVVKFSSGGHLGNPDLPYVLRVK